MDEIKIRSSINKIYRLYVCVYMANEGNSKQLYTCILIDLVGQMNIVECFSQKGATVFGWF